MKSVVYASLCAAVMAVSVWAQEQPVAVRDTALIKKQIETANVIGVAAGVEMKTVKGAPYSATAESETVQVLADGNRIRNKTATVIYRDSEGRMRREMGGKTPGNAELVFINDPVGSVNYTLQVAQRVAIKSPTEQQARALIEMRAVEAKRAAEEKQGVMLPRTAAPSGNIGFGVMSDGVAVARKKTGTVEALGQQLIEGVMCEGKRTTITIAAETVGNEQPINIVSEEWFSPELQVLVLTKQSDPRHGETTYRLTNLNRNEPARALFEVPADYTVKSPLAVKTRDG